MQKSAFQMTNSSAVADEAARRATLLYGKRQNCKTVTWPQTRTFCGWYVTQLLELILLTCVQNLTTVGLAVPVIWLESPFLMGHMTWPRPYQRRFVVGGCDLHIQLACTSNLKPLRSPITTMH